MQITLRADPVEYLKENVGDIARKKSPWDLRVAATIFRHLGQEGELAALAGEMHSQVASGMEGPTSGPAFLIAGLRICGLEAASQAVSRAAERLLATQRSDGGWGEEDKSVTFETAWCLSGLHQADALPENVKRRGISYLEKSQNEDGGWTNYDVGGKGRSCHGITPSCLWDGCGLCDIPEMRGSEMVKRAVGFVQGLQKDDGGWADDPLVTRLSLGALVKAGVPLDHEGLKRAIRWLVQHQNSDGSWANDAWDTIVVLDSMENLGVQWSLPE